MDLFSVLASLGPQRAESSSYSVRLSHLLARLNYDDTGSAVPGSKTGSVPRLLSFAHLWLDC